MRGPGLLLDYIAPLIKKESGLMDFVKRPQLDNIWMPVVIELEIINGANAEPLYPRKS